jgi:hypothetical protein
MEETGMTIENVVTTAAGSVSAHTSALAEATADLINGLRRLSPPDDLAATVEWDMEDRPR